MRVLLQLIEEDEDAIEKAKSMLKTVLQNVLLACLVIVYLLGGMYIFVEIEEENERQTLDKIKAISIELEVIDIWLFWSSYSNNCCRTLETILLTFCGTTSMIHARTSTTPWLKS